MFAHAASVRMTLRIWRVHIEQIAQSAFRRRLDVLDVERVLDDDSALLDPVPATGDAIAT